MLENLPDVATGGHLWLGMSKALAADWDRCLILPPCIGHYTPPERGLPALSRCTLMSDKDCSGPTASKSSFSSRGTQVCLGLLSVHACCRSSDAIVTPSHMGFNTSESLHNVRFCIYHAITELVKPAGRSP